MDQFRYICIVVNNNVVTRYNLLRRSQFSRRGDSPHALWKWMSREYYHHCHMHFCDAYLDAA
jgi:hypothetical protein